jgi:hypothetical protein
MILDDDIVAVSPSTVYRVLKAVGRLDGQSASSSSKGNGFKQPKNRTIIGVSIFRVSTSTVRFTT